MSNDTPSDPDGSRKGPVRRFIADFFSDNGFWDWLEIGLYAFFILLFLGAGIAWLGGWL